MFPFTGAPRYPEPWLRTPPMLGFKGLADKDKENPLQAPRREKEKTGKANKRKRWEVFTHRKSRLGLASRSAPFCPQTMGAFKFSRESCVQLRSVFSDKRSAVSADQGHFQTCRASENLHTPLFWKLLWNVHHQTLERNQARGVMRSKSGE